MHECIAQLNSVDYNGAMNTTQENIMELRQAGLSQQEIASACQVNQTTISRWELGEIPKSLEVAQAISDLLKTTRRKWRNKGKS
jgi:transcriptional regulator with XRE-family HTH domain